MAATAEDIVKAKRFMTADLAGNARVDVWLEMAQLRADRAYFGSSYPLALCYLASHIGTLETRGNGDDVGSVSSKSEGGLSVSYSAAGASEEGDLSQTVYGRYYLDLLKAKRPLPGITGGGCFGGWF
ncbi:MAG: DUF4054 domain-containing protein [Fibrobacter sp.]|nr:DUF4054 domain-containing protein [Fibrobacter sp.]